MAVNFDEMDVPYADCYADPKHGNLVTYADHVAAIAAAEQRVLAEQLAGHEMAYDEGYQRGLSKAVVAVEWVWTDVLVYKPDLRLDEIVAAIKEVGE
jgi:hypothetical protein